MASKTNNKTYKAPAPFTTKGYQNASIISVKGRRRGNGDRGFQLYCKMHKDGSDLYVLVRDTDDVIRLLTPWLVGSPFEDIYCMKVDEEFVFPADNQPVATVGWRMYGSQEQAFIPNIKSQEKPKVTEQTVAPAVNDLDEALGRKKGEPPADPHWADDKKVLFSMWVDINACGNQYPTWKQLTSDEKTDFVRNVIGSKIHETTLTRPEVVKKAIDAINAEFGSKTVEPPTAQDWLNFFKSHSLNAEYVLSLLNTDSIARGEGPVTKLSEWDKDIAAALKLVEADQGEDEISSEMPQNEAISKTAPMEPAKQNGAIVPNSTRSNGQLKEFVKLDEQAIRNKYTKKLQGGKEYLEVAGRVLLLRLEHKDWTIDTELISVNEDGAVFKARILDENGKLIASGHACAIYAKSSNFSGRVFEKAETAAIGRALAHAGYGTDDVDETDDTESPAHLADSPRAAA